MNSIEEHLKDIAFITAQFNRSSFLSELLKIVWMAYENENDESTLIRSHSSIIGCFAYAYCTDYSQRMATKEIVLDLMNRFYMMSESFTEDDSFSEKIISELINLDISFILKEKSIPNSLNAIVFIARIARHQQGNNQSYKKNILRSYEVLERSLRRKDFKRYKALINQREKIFLGVERKVLLSIGYVILGIATRTKGVIEHNFLEQLFVKDKSSFDFELDTVRAVLKRWSWDEINLKRHFHITYSQYNLDLKYAPSPLVKLPLFDMSSQDKEVYIVSNPWDLVAKIAYSSEDYLSDLLEDEFKDANSIIGKEFEKFMGEVLEEIVHKKSIINLDQYKTEKNKISDYILTEDDTAIIIEFKKSIGNSAQRSFLRPEDVAQIISRIHSAINQLASTEKQIRTKEIPLSPKINKFAFIVCFQQSILYEGSIYSELRDHITVDPELEKVAPYIILDCNNLEKYLLHFGIKEFARRIEIYHNNKDITHKPFEGHSIKKELKIYSNIQSHIFPWLKQKPTQQEGFVKLSSSTKMNINQDLLKKLKPRTRRHLIGLIQKSFYRQ